MQGRITPGIGGFEHKVFFNPNENLGYHVETPFYIPVKAAIVDRFTWKGPMNMKSWVKPNDVSEFHGDYNNKVTTRSYSINRYLAVYYPNVDSGVDTPLEDYAYGIVNVYKNENNASFAANTLAGFSVASTMYRHVSDFIKFDIGIFGSNKLRYFQGDCFYHKTWFRHGRWFSYDGANVNHQDEDGSDLPIDFVGDGYDFVDFSDPEDGDAPNNRCWIS